MSRPPACVSTTLAQYNTGIIRGSSNAAPATGWRSEPVVEVLTSADCIVSLLPARMLPRDTAPETTLCAAIISHHRIFANSNGAARDLHSLVDRLQLRHHHHLVLVAPSSPA